MEEAAYEGMVHPILEYGSSVWDPYTNNFDKLQEELEKVQNRAARFVTRNHVHETGSWTFEMGNPLRKGERIIHVESFCNTKV